MAHLATPGNRVEPLISASVEPKAAGLLTGSPLSQWTDTNASGNGGYWTDGDPKKNRSNTGNVKWIKLERVDMGKMPQNERAACDADIKATQYRWLINTISTMDCPLHEVISSQDHLWGTPTLKHSPCNSCPQLRSLALASWHKTSAKKLALDQLHNSP